jgi:uncharacterized phage protein (TIGR01671 family)
MREIKFRVWDGKKFLYTEIATRLMNDQGGWPFLRFNLSDYFVQPGHEFQIQQFTGLRDKSGKGIYEGDIVFVDEDMWEIQFQFGCFVLQYPKGGDPFALYQYPDCFVVGNIFENPELLK